MSRDRLQADRGGPPGSALRSASSALLLAAFLLKLGLVLWAVDRGYEMGDEGYFLLSLNHPESTPAAFEFYKLLAPFDLRFSVVEARLLRIAVELAGGLALVAGLFAWTRRRLLGPDGPSFSELLLFSLLGSLISLGSRSFSYNDMTSFCLYSAGGCLLYLASLAEGPEAKGRRALAAVGVGFLGGFQFFVKFPPSILLLAMASALTVWGLRALPRGERLRLLGIQAAGALAAVALFVVRNSGIGPLIEKYRISRRIADLADYDPVALLGRYVAGEILTYPNLLLMVLVFVLTMRLLRRRARHAAVSGALAAAASVLGLSAWTLHPFFLPPSALYLSCFLAFATGLLWILRSREGPAPTDRGGEREWVRLAPLLVPILLPVVGFVGTNVPFSLRLPTHALPLFAALAVLSSSLRGRSGCAGLHGVLLGVGIVVSTVLFVQHHLFEPYGLRSPIYQQTEEVAGLSGIRTDLATKHFLEATAESLGEAGFRAGDPIVALDYMPGLVFYLEGRSPGWPFYVFDRPELNCFNLERAGLDRTPFLVLGRPMSEAQHACIEAFEFPEDFRLVRTLRFPYEEVYASFDAPGISHVRLYAPRRRHGDAEAP